MLQKNKSLLLDLYELTMSAAYLRYKPHVRAVFDLFIRQKPPNRGYFIFAGLSDVLRYLKDLSFKKEDIAYLKTQKIFPEDFLAYLKKFRFTGDVWSMPEGTVFFPEEPVIRVTAPIIEAQIVESRLLNIVNLQTTLATKASRVVYSAEGRPIYDFSLRRTQGEDGGLQAARCSFMAGCAGTSNVFAGKHCKIPIVGTMAHSFVMSFTSELASYNAFAHTFPKSTVLLIDTYDQMKGLEKAIRIAKEMEKRGDKLLGIRIDSGDIARDSRRMRNVLDKNGLEYVKILASGNLDEYKIKELVAKGAKIDGFGVGTHMGTSSDMPYSDVIYKISAITDSLGRSVPTMKLSSGKTTFPGLKQVYRRYDKNGLLKWDIITVEDERIRNATPLLIKVMEKGKKTYGIPSLRDTRGYCLRGISVLPERYKKITKHDTYPVLISKKMKMLSRQVKQNILKRSKVIGISPVVFKDIDTQCDFIHTHGKLSVRGAHKIIPNLRKITEYAKKRNITVIASVDRHSKKDPEFKIFPPHCVEETKGQKKIPETTVKKSVVLSHKKRHTEEELREKIKGAQCIILEKDKLSVFTNPNAETLLREAIHVYLYGVATEYCVRAAAIGLRNMGIKTTVIKDAIMAVDEKEGAKAIKELENMGVEFIKTKELLRRV